VNRGWVSTPRGTKQASILTTIVLIKMETLLTLLGTKGIQIMASFIRLKHMPQQRAATVRLLGRVRQQKAMAQLPQGILRMLREETPLLQVTLRMLRDPAQKLLLITLMLREVIVNHQACILTQKEIPAKR